MSLLDRSSGEPRRFDLLMLDYQMARDDERTFVTIQAAVASLAVAFLAAVASAVSDACDINGNQPGCKHIPREFLAGAPAIPLAALAFMQLFGMVAALRSYYIRAVESELRMYADSPLTELNEVGPIKPVSYYGLITEVLTLRRGRAGYRTLATMIMLISLAAFGGLTLFIAIKLDDSYRNIMLIGYGVAFTVLAADVAAATFGARSTFVRIALKFRDRQHRSLLSGVSSGVTNDRSLTSYLLLPRPEDWIKWLFVPGAYFVASWVKNTAVGWGKLALAVLITEYLVYSARYQWNDIRGMSDDAVHPQSAARLRLPASQDRERRRFVITVSLIVALLRVATAIALGAIIGQTTWVLSLVGLVFTIAAIYEFLRTKESSDAREAVRKLAAVTLWVAVGAGYALRYLVGLHTADVPLQSGLAASGAVFMFTFGIMFVLLTWTLEASSYCYRQAERPSQSTANSPKGAKPSWFTDDRLACKPHLRILLKTLATVKVRHGWSGEMSMEPCGDKPVLRYRVPIHSPWNIAYWSASLAGVWLGINLWQEDTGGYKLIWLVISSLAGAVIVSYSLNPTSRAMIAIIATVVLWGVAAGASKDFDPWSAAASVIPWTLATTTYLSFRSQTYERLKNLAKDLSRLSARLAQNVVKVITGPQTWETIR
ncbi:hypothetical protein [Streptomyces sp. NPDC054794]